MILQSRAHILSIVDSKISLFWQWCMTCVNNKASCHVGYYPKLLFYVTLLRFLGYFLYKPTSKQNTNSVALVRERIIPTERPPLVGEVSANLCG
jgi:hypothetical protein